MKALNYSYERVHYTLEALYSCMDFKFLDELVSYSLDIVIIFTIDRIDIDDQRDTSAIIWS